MRHRVAGKKLNRNSSHRKALSRNLMRAMIIEWQGKGHIVTTRSKAKYIQPKIEKMITLAKEKTVHNIRRAMAEIGDRDSVQVLFDEIGPYYQQRPGGYTRILRLVKPRLGDAAIRAYLGFVREDDEYPEGDRRAKGAPEAAAPAESAQAVEEVTEEASESNEAATDGESAAEQADSAPVEASAEDSSEDQADSADSAGTGETGEEATDSAEEADEASDSEEEAPKN